MRPYIYHLKANKTEKVGVKGNFYRVTEGTAPVEVREDHSAVRATLKRGQGVKSDSEFNQISLKSEVDQTIEIFIGFGQMFDDRVSGAIDAAGLISVVSLGGKSYDSRMGIDIANGQKFQLLAENLNRVSASISADFDFIYSGSEADVDNDVGMPFVAGAYMERENTAVLWAKATSAGKLNVLESLK